MGKDLFLTDNPFIMGQWERVGHHHRFQAEMGLAYIRLPEDKQKQLVTDGGNINVEVKSVNYMAG